MGAVIILRLHVGECRKCKRHFDWLMYILLCSVENGGRSLDKNSIGNVWSGVSEQPRVSDDASNVDALSPTPPRRSLCDHINTEITYLHNQFIFPE